MECFKYLGVQIDAQLRWKEQAQRAIANATKWILQFRRLTRPSTGVKSKLMRQLYLAVALPKITYGLDVWYTPPTKPAGFSRNTGSVGILRSLQKTQRIATIAITGALRSAPTDLIDAHAGLLPVELALLKACHRAMVRTLTLPSSHPLHRIIAKAKRYPPEKHLSSLDQLLKTFKLGNAKIETIDSANRITSSSAQFTTNIAKNREASITNEHDDKADYKVYSDGSGQEDGIGASTIMYKRGTARPVRMLQLYLGSKKKHNTYEAEAAGAILATWIVRNTPETIGKMVTLYIDNQAIIMALRGAKPTSGQHLINTIMTAANQLPCRFSIEWISSHSEVKGNEAADRIAKAAAQGRSSRALDLPHIFRTPIPISASATKQEFSARLARLWTRMWDDSPRKDRFSRIDSDFPFNKFRKRLFAMSRKQASIIMQVRTGHIALNFYLKCIGKLNTDNCTKCEEGPHNVHVQESINHFLFDCQGYEEERMDLTAKIGRSQLSILKIMKNADHMKSLVTYINRTGRLKDNS